MKSKVIFVVGTRPELIKIAPITNKIPSTVLFTGQHFDANMSDDFFELLNANELHNLNLNEKSVTSVLQMASSIANELAKFSSQKILVMGDTNSTLSGAIAAKHVNKQLYYIESGMRTGDLMQIEEFNRILVSHLSDINFCNHINNKNNLIMENILSEKIKITGSTVYSSLKLAATETRKPKKYENYILLTLHRPKNVDNINKLNSILRTIDKLQHKVLFPIHPRTKMKLGSVDFNNIQLIDPQNYFSFIDLMKSSKFIISDSGGVQEEAAILRKPLIIPREYTERPEMLGKFNLLANNINDLYIESEKVINNSSNLCTSVLESDLLYGKEEPVDKIIEYII